MLIKIFGPVGSGKSTISREVARVFGIPCIPEVEDNDVKFFRLLNKRNRTQKIEDKMEFQCYTFEQAYSRQYGIHTAVIDTPIDQHFIMASCSLNKEEIKEYESYYSSYLKKVNFNSFKTVNIVLYLPFGETLKRIKSRGRVEEKISTEEIEFYKSFYDELFSVKRYPEGSILIDATKDVESIVLDIVKKVGGIK